MKTEKTKPAELSRAQLERKVLELTAQLAHAYHFDIADKIGE